VGRGWEREDSNLLAARISASSKNKMLGAASRALRKVFRNKASPSPTYIEYNSAPLCDINYHNKTPNISESLTAR